MKLLFSLCFLNWTLLFSQCGYAHHSFSMFDMSKTVTLQGTVKEFQWMNPHCFIQLLVTTENGIEEWSLETHSTTALYRLGLRPNSMKFGDQLLIDVNPVRKGTHGGFAAAIKDSKGKPLYKTVEGAQ